MERDKEEERKEIAVFFLNILFVFVVNIILFGCIYK